MYVLTGCTYRKPKGHKGKRGKPLSKRGRSLRHYVCKCEKRKSKVFRAKVLSAQISLLIRVRRLASFPSGGLPRSSNGSAWHRTRSRGAGARAE